MTDNVVSYLRQAAATQTKNVFAETLASMLREPKLYLVRAIVNNLPNDLIFDLLGLTIDIQSGGGMLLSEAGVELRQK